MDSSPPNQPTTPRTTAAASLRSSAIRAGIESQVRTQWPDLPWEGEAFLEFLAQRIHKTSDSSEAEAVEALEERLGALLIPDLYLAFACLRGLPGAAETFDAAMRPVLSRALSGIVRTPGQVDDVRQAVYEKLFTPAPGVQPAIEKYDGVGALRSWVRVTAVRIALNVHRSRRRERPLSPGLLLTRSDGQTGPEESYLKRLYSGAFKQAFEQALGALTPEQRNLLRYYYLNGLTVEQVGRIYGVHKATISRRLSDIREQLLTETRNQLLRALDVEQPELESILRLIHSRMDASICRYLAPDD